MSAIDPDLDVAALRVLAARLEAERDIARAGERAAQTMARDAAVEKVAALERYRVEVVEHVRASGDKVTGIVRRLEAEVADLRKALDALALAKVTAAQRPALTEAQAREMRQECFEHVDIDTMPDRTINALCDAIDAALLAASRGEYPDGPESGTLPADYAARRAQGETGHGMATPIAFADGGWTKADADAHNASLRQSGGVGCTLPACKVCKAVRS